MAVGQAMGAGAGGTYVGGMVEEGGARERKPITGSGPRCGLGPLTASAENGVRCWSHVELGAEGLDLVPVSCPALATC
jgi:hypothetical protein